MHLTDKNTPKFSFYTIIHKAIRKEIFQLCLIAGKTDFSDFEAADFFKKEMTEVFSFLREHSRHEEIFIHPLLEALNIDEFKFINKEHEVLEVELGKLEKLLSQFINPNSCVESANEFYLELCQFASHYLAHLYFEENNLMPILATNYELSELMTAMDSFKNGQSLEQTFVSLNMILSSISPQEALILLTEIKQSAPTELFIKICHLAERKMLATDWQKISVVKELG
ncbi:MAG: hemerythrin domain-containing protein [Tatlockia sp.]|nr:hemerythrin domain-containing protein [Tatlockia sp.]